MKISKDSWHYRFNDYIQSDFGYRAEREVFTTCTYIRTTIRTMFEAAFKLSLILFFVTLGALVVGSAIYLPIAKLFALPLLGFVEPFAGVTYAVITALLLGTGYEKFLKPALERRREQKISLLRQAMKDKKEGICTIVEFE